MTDTGPTDTEIANSYGLTAETAPLYSLWKQPGDKHARTIRNTEPDGSQTWIVNIGKDELADIFSAFLEANGAAVLESPVKRNAYTDELERQLKSGSCPTAARDAALAVVNETTADAEFRRRNAEGSEIIARRMASGEFG